MDVARVKTGTARDSTRLQAQPATEPIRTSVMTAKLDAAVSSSLVVGDGVAASKAAILEKFPVKRLVSTPRGTDEK